MILRYGQLQEAANDESPIPRTRNANILFSLNGDFLNRSAFYGYAVESLKIRHGNTVPIVV